MSAAVYIPGEGYVCLAVRADNVSVVLLPSPKSILVGEGRPHGSKESGKEKYTVSGALPEIGVAENAVLGVV